MRNIYIYIYYNISAYMRAHLGSAPGFKMRESAPAPSIAPPEVKDHLQGHSRAVHPVYDIAGLTANCHPVQHHPDK